MQFDRATWTNIKLSIMMLLSPLDHRSPFDNKNNSYRKISIEGHNKTNIQTRQLMLRLKKRK